MRKSTLWNFKIEKVLFINACPRESSRTRELADLVLDNLKGFVSEVNLFDTKISPLDSDGIFIRDLALKNHDFSHKFFDLSKEFAEADTIVIAAPYWDMMFPSVLKTYLENITVCGITFQYSESGRPESKCRAKTLYYITSAGGFIGENDFGFAYVEALAKNFFGISKLFRFTAEGLDLVGANTEQILKQAKENITKAMR